MKINISAFSLLFTLNFVNPAFACSKISVLSFELRDITSLPYTEKEIARTAQFQPMLIQSLQSGNDFQVVDVPRHMQKDANPGFGYLFTYPDEARSLGEKLNTDWLIVTRHTKPSHLFSYLVAKLIHVDSGKLIKRIDIELKGNNQKVNQRGIRRLSKKLVQLIKQHPCSNT